MRLPPGHVASLQTPGSFETVADESGPSLNPRLWACSQLGCKVLQRLFSGHKITSWGTVLMFPGASNWCELMIQSSNHIKSSSRASFAASMTSMPVPKPTMGLTVAAVHLNLLKVLYLRKHSGSRIVDTHRNSPTHDSLERAGCWQSHQIYNQPLSITPGGSFDHWGVGGFPLPQGRIFLVPTPVLLGSLVRHVHLWSLQTVSAGTDEELPKHHVCGVEHPKLPGVWCFSLK